MNRYVDTYLENRQTRRKEKKKQQRQTAAGLPLTRPLKAIAFSQEQANSISNIRFPSSYLSRREAAKRVLNAKRVSALFTLALHLIAALIGTLYFVESKAIDDDAVIVEMLEAHEVPKKRQIARRVIERIERPQSVRIEVPQLSRPLATSIATPQLNARFTLPPSDVRTALLASDGKIGLSANELGKGLRVERQPVKTARLTPLIRPQRTMNSSIIEQIESVAIPQKPLEVKPDESPMVALSDVTQPPRFLKQAMPRYPSLARRAAKEGVVLLEASIGIDGVARDIRVLEGVGYGCDEEAVKALQASRFAPAMRDKRKVIVTGVTIPYRFSLAQS